MSKDLDARTVLERFAPQLRWVTDSVMQSFDLEPHFKDDVRQEAEIRVMAYADMFNSDVDGHGRLAQWTSRADGVETQIKALLAYQLRIDLAKDTSRMIHRNGDSAMHDSLDRLRDEFNREPDSVPGETYNVTEPPAEPEVNYDEVMANLADADSRFLRRFVRDYPFLAMQVIGEMPTTAIAKQAGVSLRTAKYRLAAERSDLAPIWTYEDSLFGDWLKTLNREELAKIRTGGLYDYLVLEVSEKITDNGHVDLLVVEGDEDLEDLVEAKTNLFAVGR